MRANHLDAMQNVAMRRQTLIALALLTTATAALADPPDFDRPGAGFATNVLPAGGFALEQGLPTFTRERQSGLTDDQYTADSLIRIGLGGPAELQLGGSLWNRLNERGNGLRGHVTGHGDSSAGLKLSPSSDGAFSWAALGQVTFANGNDAFSNGAKEYSLGATGQWTASESYATTLYANVDRLQGRNTWTLAPTFDFKFANHWMAYLETDLIHDADEGNEGLAGGGLALIIGEHVQADASVLHRVGARGPVWQAGLGLSVYFGPAPK
jgi:hypothetical protein